MPTKPANGQTATKVVTGKVRLSYVHLFEPFSNDPDIEATYSCVILIPKSDTATLGRIDRAFKAAAEQGKNSRFEGKIPKNLKTTLRDGDEEMDLDDNPEYEGHMFMNLRSKTKPGIIDEHGNPIIDSTEVYSGCYARVSMGAFAYNTQGSKGLSFGLNHVMKVADGDNLGGRSKAEDDFADFIGEGDDDGDDDGLI